MAKTKAKQKKIKPRGKAVQKKRRSVARAARGGKPTKQEQLLGMLRRPEGATIAQLTEALGWQPHSVRGAMATIKKKSGVAISSEKPEGGLRVYRIA